MDQRLPRKILEIFRFFKGVFFPLCDDTHSMTLSLLEQAARISSDHKELELFSETIDRSVYNLVPAYMQAAIDSVPKEYFLVSESQLKRELCPSFEDSQLRMAFWTEYQRAQFSNTRMNMKNVYGEIYSQNGFTDYIVKDPRRVGWVIRPPADWVSGMRAILNEGMQLMWQVVNASNIIEGGEINAKSLNAAMRVIEKAMVVVHGLPVVRTELKAMNVNVSAPSTLQVEDLEKAQAEIKKLQAQLNPPTRDVVSNE